MSSPCLTQSEQAQARYARHRAIILQAINNQPGMTYTQIRNWIEANKHFTMEEIGRRVRELAREIEPRLAIIQYDENGRVRVYPTEEPKL